METLDCLYNEPLNEVKCDKSNGQKAPRIFNTMHWKAFGEGSITYDEDKRNLYVELWCEGHDSIVSNLQNGIYSFSIQSNYSYGLVLHVYASNLQDVNCCQITVHVKSSTVNLIIYDKDIFMKITEDNKGCKTYSATAPAESTCFKCKLDGYDGHNSFQIINSS